MVVARAWRRKQLGHVSCGSIWIEWGWKVRPRPPVRAFRPRGLKASQSNVRPGRQVGVVVAHGTVHLPMIFTAEIRSTAPCRRTTTLAPCPRWWGWPLAMGAAEHGQRRHAGAPSRAAWHDAVEAAAAPPGRARHVAGVAGVVDVFARAGKVHELPGSLGCTYPNLLLIQYSTAFTSWLVVFSIS